MIQPLAVAQFIASYAATNMVDGQGIPSFGHFLARFGGVCPTQNQYMFTGTDATAARKSPREG
jgi:hypothetical protein